MAMYVYSRVDRKEEIWRGRDGSSEGTKLLALSHKRRDWNLFSHQKKEQLLETGEVWS
jgi:hypothetical protein